MTGPNPSSDPGPNPGANPGTAPILRQRDALRALVDGWHQQGQTVAVVPTMGALHAGHLSLVDAAQTHCDRVIVTIFVNPKQFNNPEDLANYPRTEDQDRAKLAGFAVDALYVPDPDQIYPEGFATTVSVTGLTDGLCGAHRPGHFDGVATVVTKLFTQTQADRAYFGEKDYQQLLLVRRLARDLDLRIEVIGCPTVRDPDGLAMSSRNQHLTPQDRAIAPVLGQAMRQAAQDLRAGADWNRCAARATETLRTAGFSQVEYFELRSAATLSPMDGLTQPARLLAAAMLGGVRLIDNIAVDLP